MASSQVDGGARSYGTRGTSSRARLGAGKTQPDFHGITRDLVGPRDHGVKEILLEEITDEA
jgi:hypothetical protein